MKQTSKLFALLLAVVMLFSSMTVLVSAEDNITVTLNGQSVSFDAKPELENGRTMVPMRAVFEAFGCTLDFDEATGTVTGVKDDTTITLKIGETTATAGSETLTLDAAPYLKEGRTYVPVRFIAESLKSQVGWDPVKQEVIVINLDKLEEDLMKNSPLAAEMLNTSAATEQAIDEQVELSFTATLAGAEDTQPAAGTITIQANGQENGLEGTASATVSLDAAALIEKAKTLIPADSIDEQTSAILDALSKKQELTVELMATKDLTLYAKAANLQELVAAFGGEAAAKLVQNDTWYKLDLASLLNSIYQQVGINLDFKTLLGNKNVNLIDSLRTMLNEAPTSDDAQMIASMYTVFTTLFSDKTVTKTTAEDGTVTYAINITTETMVEYLLNIMAANGADPQVIDVFKQELTKSGMDMSMRMNLSIKDAVTTSGDMSFSYTQPIPATEQTPAFTLGFAMEMKASSQAAEHPVEVVAPETAIDITPIIQAALSSMPITAE